MSEIPTVPTCILSPVNTLNGMMRVNWVLRAQTCQGGYDEDSTRQETMGHFI